MNRLPAVLSHPQDLYAAAEGLPFPDSIGSLLYAAAAERPHQVALRLIAGGSYTYTELCDAVAVAANALTELGMRKNHRLAILLPNVAEYPIVYLAAATLGICVVPINTAYTVAEIEYVLGDSGATFAIVEESLRPALEAATVAVPSLSTKNIVVVGGRDDSRSWARRCQDQVATRMESGSLDALMTIQYTSGTTGFPKGALLSQRYWITVGLSQSVELAHLDVRNILVVHSFFYMDPFWQLMLSLVLRGTIVLAPRMSASNFMAWARAYEIHYALVTSLIYKQPPTELDALHHLRLLQTYGFSKEIHADFEARFKVPVREVYGMTEIGAGAFLPLVATNMIGSGSVGIAAPFRRLKIVDAAGAEVAPGEIGELWVTGVGLFSGYNNLPAVSADALADGWMRTGDLFRQDESGYYYLVGRLKDMVRRNMENVSAHEVEQVLIGHPSIALAAVMAVPDAEKGEEVLALVVLRDGVTREQVTPMVIRDYCSTRLAKFKLPRYIGYRKSLPMTPSAKVAKGELRKEMLDLRVGCFDLATHGWIAPGG